MKRSIVNEADLVKEFCETHNLEIRSLKPLRLYDKIFRKEIKPKSLSDLVEQVTKLRSGWLDEFR